MKARKKYYDYSERWVDCLDCSKEYVVEPLVKMCCPVCGSYEYEESTSERAVSINEYDVWGD